MNNQNMSSRWLLQFLLIYIAAITLQGNPASAQVKFTRAFSPQNGLTAPVEQPWRQEICLNGHWDFQPVALPANYDLKNGAPSLPKPDPDGWSSTPIRIPSPWNVNSFGWGSGKTFPSYPADWDNARMGWMRRHFTVPSGWDGKRLILHFEAICGYAQVLVNGHLLTEHFDNSLPFEVDITEFVNNGGNNELLVGVRQANLFDIQGDYGKLTYPSGSPWTRQMIGIWQDVFLQALPPLRVDKVAIRSLVDQGVLELIVNIRNNTPQNQMFSIGGHIQPWISEAGKDIVSAPEPSWSLGNPILDITGVTGSVGPKMTSLITIRIPVNNKLALWSMDTPNLYGLILDVIQNDKPQDRYYERFGWRQWSINGRDLILNGKPVTLLGDAGHILGIQYLTSRYAWSWYHALKMANGNAIRLHATVRPRFYLDLADEMGIAILDESDIWGSTMDINYYTPETWLRFGAHIDGMVERDLNHASVFGWSIANEVLSALWFKGVPRDFWQPIIEKSADLADRIKLLDPTRPWISSDGDGDFHGRLPTYVYHYGDPQAWLRNAPKDKPFAIGEGGSMIWGSPVVYSAYNGERSYESNEGMTEGVAIECYQYLTEQRKISAYCSIFTFEGTAFKPLPIGLKDIEKTPSQDDGVFFGPFAEGQPGIQPERIAPYCTNFNPGYDPNLPFFNASPVFEAIKAAYNPGKPAPCVWDHLTGSPKLPPVPEPSIREVRFIGDSKGSLKKAFESSGIPITDASGSVVPKMLIIDGAGITTDQISSIQKQIKTVFKTKGDVFIWTTPENLENINSLLPYPISFIKQDPTALLADRKAPETAAIPLASLYFDDQSDKVIVKNVITGPLVDRSRILMESNIIKMRRRSGKADPERYPVLIASDMNGGKLLVTSLTPDIRSERRMQLIRNVFANLRVALSAPSEANNTGFDGAGFINEAMIIGSFQGERYPGIMDLDFLGGESQADPKPGDKAGGRTWQTILNQGDGVFDFYRLKLPGTEGTSANSLAGNTLRPEALDGNGYLESPERLTLTSPGVYSAAYLSFWLYSPIDVNEKAASMDAPKISLLITSDDGKKIWLNQHQIVDDRMICGPGITNSGIVPLTLKEGWNHFLVKVGQQDGAWSFSAHLECPDKDLAGKLRVSATKGKD